MIVNLNGSSGATGTIALDNGDSGMLAFSGGANYAVAIDTPTPAPTATFGPVTLTPSVLNFTFVGQTLTTVASQPGNGDNQFIVGVPISCPGGVGNATFSVSGATISATAVTPSTGTCTVPVIGHGGFQATHRPEHLRVSAPTEST